MHLEQKTIVRFGLLAGWLRGPRQLNVSRNLRLLLRGVGQRPRPLYALGPSRYL